MFIRKALVALATAGMVFGSSAAAAAPVAVDEVRAASPVAEGEELRGSFLYMLLIIVAAAIVGIIAADGNEAVSP